MKRLFLALFAVFQVLFGSGAAAETADYRQRA
mgnify:CR=1 FL=1